MEKFTQEYGEDPFKNDFSCLPETYMDDLVVLKYTYDYRTLLQSEMDGIPIIDDDHRTRCDIHNRNTIHSPLQGTVQCC